MNHVGSRIQKYIGKNDTVLDVGCGIMQATMDMIPTQKPNKDLKCKAVLGIDAFGVYLEEIKDRRGIMVMRADVTDIAIWDNFLDKSFDAVFALDILEHLKLEQAVWVLGECERVARKYVFIYTPIYFRRNETHAETDNNPLLYHQCLIKQESLEKRGYEIELIQNKSMFGVLKK